MKKQLEKQSDGGFCSRDREEGDTEIHDNK